MEVFIPMTCLLVLALLGWASTVAKPRAQWTRRNVAQAVLAAAGALAVPFLVFALRYGF